MTQQQGEVGGMALALQAEGFLSGVGAGLHWLADLFGVSVCPLLRF